MQRTIIGLAGALLIVACFAAPAAAQSPTPSPASSSTAGNSILSSLLKELLGTLPFGFDSVLSTSTLPSATGTLREVTERVPLAAKGQEGLDALARWFKETFGLDFYQLLKALTSFALATVKIALDLAAKAVDWLQAWLSLK